MSCTINCSPENNYHEIRCDKRVDPCWNCGGNAQTCTCPDASVILRLCATCRARLTKLEHSGTLDEMANASCPDCNRKCAQCIRLLIASSRSSPGSVAWSSASSGPASVTRSPSGGFDTIVYGVESISVTPNLQVFRTSNAYANPNYRPPSEIDECTRPQ